VLLDQLAFVDTQETQDQLVLQVPLDSQVLLVLLVRLAHKGKQDQQVLLATRVQLVRQETLAQLDLLVLLVLEDLLFQKQHQPDLQMVMFGLTLRMHLTLLLVFTFIIAMLMDVNGLNMETHSLVQLVQLEKLVLRVQQVLQVP
jgi:hypothetical protein